MQRFWVPLFLLLATACRQSAPTPTPPTTATYAPPPKVPLQAAKLPTPALPRADFGEYRQSVPPDAITPIYDPEFVPAAEAPFQDEELVLGVEIDLDARAYPIGVLRFREMVNDKVGGVPILVSW